MNKLLKIGLFVLLLLLFIPVGVQAYRCLLAPEGKKYCALKSCYSCRQERKHVRKVCKYPKTSELKRNSLRGPDHSGGYVKNGLYYPGNMSDELSKHGYGIGYVKRKGPDGTTIYDGVVNLPCFYDAPGNSPCDRGSFSKKRKGVGRSRSMRHMGHRRRVQLIEIKKKIQQKLDKLME